MRRSLEAMTMAVLFAALTACGGGGEEADTGGEVATDEEVGPAVSPDLAMVIAPALKGAQVDAGQAAGRGQPGPSGASLSDGGHQDLAVLPAGHSPSPSRKTACSFFPSTSKAAVSASALSFLCSSRSSSLTRRRSCRA